MNETQEKSEVEETGAEGKIGYWLKWIRAAKDCKERKRHAEDAQAAYDEYELAGRGKDGSGVERVYPIYAESCWTLEPAFFAQNPKIIAKRKYGTEDGIALTMSLIAERLGQHLVDTSNFGDAIEAAVQDYIHASKATVQVVYSAEADVRRVPLTPEPPESPERYYSAPGVEYSGEVRQDEEGYFAEEPAIDEASQAISVVPVLYDEILHTPEAKTEADITEKAFKFCLDYETAEEKFNTGPGGESLNRTLPYVMGKEKDEDGEDYDGDDTKSEKTRQLYGWEIWCKKSKKVYWVCEGYKDDFLVEPQPDPYGLEGFFPTPDFIIKNKRRKNMFPVPTWRYLEPTANQLHRLYERIFVLIGCVERKALVYGASPELIGALNSLTSGQFIAVGQAADILNQGGINKMIEWVDVQSLVQAISECLQLEQAFSERFSVAFGIPDILKGISDPAETAEAQGIKSDAGHNRFKKDKKKILELARAAAEMALDLALKVFSDEKIAKICGYEFLEAGDPGTPPTPPSEENPQGDPGSPPRPSHKELFKPALDRLRNDADRIVTIDFETDSTNFRDEQREMERSQMISNTVLQGLSTIGQIQNPEFVNTALSLLLATIDSMGGSSKSENMIKMAVSDLEKRKKQPPPPPPPDVDMLKLELAKKQQELDTQIIGRELQQRDLEIQIKQMTAQASVQAEQTRSALQSQIEGMRIALQNKEAQVNEQEAISKIAVKGKELEIKTIDAERDRQLDLLKIQSEQKLAEMTLAMEQQKIDNDRLRVQQEEVLSKLRIVESLMEERRLSKDNTVNHMLGVAEALKPDAPKE